MMELIKEESVLQERCQSVGEILMTVTVLILISLGAHLGRLFFSFNLVILMTLHKTFAGLVGHIVCWGKKRQ